MNISNITTPQGFKTQFNAFLATKARVPVNPIGLRGDKVIYGFKGSISKPPIKPMIHMGSERIDVQQVGSNGGRDPSGRNSLAMKMRQLADIIAPINQPAYRFGNLRCMDSRHIDRRHIMREALVMVLRDGEEKFDDAAVDLFKIARGYRLSEEFTFAAVLAESAAFLMQDITYYSAAAADCWLKSLTEYDDPSTARLRVSRGILNSDRFFNRTLAIGLFAASADIYMKAKEKKWRDMAFDNLRAADAVLRGDRWVDAAGWRRVRYFISEAANALGFTDVDRTTIKRAREFSEAAKGLAEAA